jgi:hypothetical protein
LDSDTEQGLQWGLLPRQPHLLAEVGEQRSASITQLTTAELIVRASTARYRN